MITNNGQMAHSYNIPPPYIITAVTHNDFKWVQQLLDRGANINKYEYLYEPPLHEAIRAKNLEMIKFLLKHGANPNQNSPQNSALHLAVRRGYIDIVQLLLEHGSDLNFQDSCGRTSLFIATEESDYDMIKFLLDRGVNTNIKDNYHNFTPKDWAVRSERKRLIELFESYEFADIKEPG